MKGVKLSEIIGKEGEQGACKKEYQQDIPFHNKRECNYHAACYKMHRLSDYMALFVWHCRSKTYLITIIQC